MAQIVYYGCLDNQLGFDLEPVKEYFVKNILNTTGMKNTMLTACPAFKDNIKNTFIIKSIFSYQINWDGENITSPMYNQTFFDEVITPRNIPDGFLSYVSPSPVFVSESNNLLITQQAAVFHDNEITAKTIMIPGTYNIGKHIPRRLELAFKFKQPGEIKIKEEDGLYYVKFHTDEEIIFKKFIWTKEMNEITKAYLGIRNFTQNYKNLKWWYNLVSRHGTRKYLLDRIKQNLL